MAKSTDYGCPRDSRNKNSNPGGGGKGGYGGYNNMGRNSKANSSGYNNMGKGNAPRQNAKPTAGAKSYSAAAAPATAPYNFIPLPSAAVEAPVAAAIKEIEQTMTTKPKDNAALQAGFKKYVEEQGKLSGTIEYTLTALTPTYIGDKGKFFGPNGIPLIPGSTMRGLIKNYLKIISCGTMKADEDFTNRHLYYRDFAGKKSNLKTSYMNRMAKDIKVQVTRVNPDTRKEEKEEQDRKDANVDAGFLVKKNDKWYIAKAEKYLKRYKAQKNFSKGKVLTIKTLKNEKTGAMEEVETYDFEDKFVKKNRKNPKTGKFEEVAQYFYINNTEPNVAMYKDHKIEKGVKVETGKMGTKGHYFVFANPDWSTLYEVPEAVMNDYRADNFKKKPIPCINLLDKKFDLSTKTSKNPIAAFAIGQHFDHLAPAFFVAKDNVVQSMGGTKYYRIPYLKAIADHVPNSINNTKAIDFADAIFGRKEDWASRVAFEDLTCKSATLAANKPHTLLGPNPTSFQLYLKQNGAGNLNHWDSNADIRGYKLYWHKKINDTDWHYTTGEQGITGDDAKIQPVGKDSVFNGRIRFNNLSGVELGALLATISYGEKGSFKIGMGKPIGMGSVKCSYTLQLIDTKKRYTQLFDDQKWNSACTKADQGTYIAEFENYMKEKTANSVLDRSYRYTLEALRIMMDWENNSLGQDYMSLQMFKERAILPTPQEIIKQKGK